MDKKTKNSFEFSITGQLEEDFLEAQCTVTPRILLQIFYYRAVGRRLLGRPMVKKTKNTFEFSITV